MGHSWTKLGRDEFGCKGAKQTFTSRVADKIYRPRSSINSSVETTFTRDCSLNAFSFDYDRQLSFNGKHRVYEANASSENHKNKKTRLMIGWTPTHVIYHRTLYLNLPRCRMRLGRWKGTFTKG